MKVLTALSILLLVYGCKHKPTSSTIDKLKIKKASTPAQAKVLYRLKDHFAVIDTGMYETGMGEGDYAIIIEDDNSIDTINRYFGIKSVGDKYLYLKLTKDADLEKLKSQMPNSRKTIGADEQGYILIDQGKKQNMVKIAPDFNSYFSAPAVINDKIYYWQLKQVHRDSAYRDSAAEYNPSDKTIKSYYLEDNFIETDDDGYFGIPYLKSDTIYFESGSGKTGKFTTDFKPYN